MHLFSKPSFLVTDPSIYATRANSSPLSVQEAGKSKTYDYIIIGGGTAGCVLASRLSQDPTTAVLLLEAGGTNEVIVAQAPLTFAKQFKTEQDWNYTTVAQALVDGREQYWPRGKLLGGCSSMNAMMFHHGSPSDFDEWDQVHGCKGWSYNDLEPYLKRVEKYTPNPARPSPLDASHRGQNGVYHIGHHSYLSEIGGKAFVEACVENGIAYCPDVNTPQGTVGVTQILTSIDPTGKRVSAATAYLPLEVQKRPNLTIAIHILASRIVFDRSAPKPKAIAVELQKQPNREKYHVCARRKILLCAGAVNTPQLLMLSGIGPSKSILEQYGIPTVVDNANVGKHLKDHFCASTILCRAKRGTTLDYLSNNVKALLSLFRWFVTGGGPISSNLAESAAFVKSNDPMLAQLTNRDNRPQYHGSLGKGPDLEILVAPVAYIDHGFQLAPPGHNVLSLVPIGLRPQSSGEITLQSSDPWVNPRIDPKYWSDQDKNDRKVLLAGVRLALRIARSKPLEPFLEQMSPNDDPESFYWPWSATNLENISDQQLWCYMAKRSFTLYHPVSTARMGRHPVDSVVDLDLNVHGVDGLSVCDASVFPDQISGHPTATLLAMAEKTADLLLSRSLYQ